MKQFLCGLVAWGLFVGVTGNAKGQPSYAFSTFSVPGAYNTRGFSINDAGPLVGTYTSTRTGPAQGFLVSGASYTTLQGPARGINDAGQIVGAFTDASGMHGYLLSGGNLTSLDVPGADTTIAAGICSTGQIVGEYIRLNGALSRGFLYNGTNYLDLPIFGSPQSQANGMNALGVIVGQYEDNHFGVHGYVINDGNVTMLDPPGAATRGVVGTSANGINDAGIIVGNYGDGTRYRGFIYENGVFTTLDVPGAGDTYINGINNLGQLVGSYDTTLVSPQYFGFIATPNLAPVPEPATLLLLGIGTLGVIGLARRRHR